MKKIAIATFVVASASLAQAQDDLGRALSRMGAASGESYAAARDAVVNREGARAELEKVLREEKWTRESYPRLAAATMALGRIAHPELVKRVENLQGVNPETYLKRRRPDPECSSELRALGKDAVGPMLERLFKTFESQRFSSREDLAAKERLALRVGLVIALSRSGHPAAHFACSTVAWSSSEPEAVRSQAIEGLGDVGTSEALGELVRLHGTVELPASLRLAAVRGVALVPSVEALSFLKEKLASEDAAVRKTAVVSLGVLGSAWSWESREDARSKETADAVRRGATAALVGAIDRLHRECGDQLVDAIATVAHESAVGLLERQLERRSESSSVSKAALDRVRMAIERNERNTKR